MTTGYSRGPEQAKGSSPPARVRADSNGVKKKKRKKMSTAKIDWKALDDDPDAFVEARKHLKRHSPAVTRRRPRGAF